MLIATIALLFACFATSFVLGYFFSSLAARVRKGSIRREIDDMLHEAKQNANQIEERALEQARKAREEFDRHEDRLHKLDERLERKENELSKRELAVSQEYESLRKKSEEMRAVKDKLEEKSKEYEKRVALAAHISEEEAKTLLFANLEREYKSDIEARLFKLSRDGESRLEAKARDILATALYRIGNTEVASFSTSTVELEDEEVKGKIIGKEGRNIKAFERATGTELIIDDTPNSIVVSCFDPVRRAIAVTALHFLVKDGRIQPAKIEEFVEKAKKEVGALMKKKGEEAIHECGLVGVPEQVVALLGRLYFRTSYGQNVLTHSVEMAHIAGMLASELGADVYVAKAGALLHDIGKAVDHDIQGTHVEIGRKILKKYGVDDRIILAMQSHHEEYPYETIESILVQVADAVSAGRPGARRDTVEKYIEKLGQLEALALAFEGIEKAYALQAGREIRVFVTPEIVSDLEARKLARTLALRIEEELRYPGEIKVHVIRESRVIEFAR